MKSHQDMLYAAQARRITSLTEQNNELLRELERHRCAGGFYLELQKLIIENEMLQDEWERFMMFLVLNYPGIKGYTTR